MGFEIVVWSKMTRLQGWKWESFGMLMLRLIPLSILVLMGGCAQHDNTRFCTAVATNQYSEYRKYTSDDPPMPPSEISRFTEQCLDDLR